MAETMVKIECKTPRNVANDLTQTICVQKANLSVWQLILLGIMAGVYVGFGAVFATLVSSDATRIMGFGVGRMITGAVFSVGLILVNIAGAELFTGNNLIIMGAFDKRISFRRILRHWGIIYFANFLGAILFAWIMFNTNLWKISEYAIGVEALNIANTKVNLTWSEAFFRGVACNWLVCLAFWMASASREVIGRIFAIFFPIMTFVALGFEHSIANIYYISSGIMLKGTGAGSILGKNLGALTWWGGINNLIPVTAGNIVGGAICVGFLYWAAYVKLGETTS